MALSFSQRIGQKPIRTILQVDDMDMDLRNSLWNYCQTIINKGNIYGATIEYHFLELVWAGYFKNRAVKIFGANAKGYDDFCYKHFTSANWYEVYDLVEFVLENVSSNKTTHIQEINKILEREMSGYRIINNEITPITDKSEISEIEEARENPKAETHIISALSLLSDRKTPDYRNSVKESISAVEAVCRQVTGKNTLGQALVYMRKNRILEIDEDFSLGLEKLYQFTNNPTTGIRHALMETGKDITFEDAKFMLVMCSAFVNYITAKTK